MPSKMPEENVNITITLEADPYVPSEVSREYKPNTFKFGDKVRVKDEGEIRFCEIGIYIADMSTSSCGIFSQLVAFEKTHPHFKFTDYFKKESLELVNE